MRSSVYLKKREDIEHKEVKLETKAPETTRHSYKITVKQRPKGKGLSNKNRYSHKTKGENKSLLSDKFRNLASQSRYGNSFVTSYKSYTKR